ncbi:MAG: indolepyruvate oxidoreductase subunit beta [Desulfovibrio sp.]|uniref:indolepyruvate oxidoreductase subunit beta n=1 Tax=Desulfovibrio sp. 7SRBS1 TaxID=3378064 RepID=UPI003B41530D
MSDLKKRIFLTGVGGQGTLTATKILAQAALDNGLPVTAGEIHGMAQRGGVVESTVLIGGYRSPKIAHGQAHILLGFEPLETLRALPYLAKDAVILSSSEIIPPIGVTAGRETYPSMDSIKEKAAACSRRSCFIPCLSLGREAGSEQSANMVLLGGLCALNELPFGLDRLSETIKANLKPKLVDMNLAAIKLGAKAVLEQKV